jgi:prevent-host-death family protein
MKTATVTEAKAHLSRLLALVRRGETVLILHRGSPVARLQPVREADEQTDEGRLLGLVRAGVVRRGSQPPDRSALGRPGRKLPRDRGLLDALLADREEGR